MSSPYDFDTEGDIGLGDEDKGRVKSNKLDWYQVTDKGRTDRVALVYFHPFDLIGLNDIKKKKTDLTDAQQKAVMEKIRATHAEKLGRKPDELDVVDMLDTSTVRFKAVDASYKEGLGYVAWPKGSTIDASDKEVWSKLPEKRTYVMTVLLVYPTDREGIIEKDRLGTGWYVKPWRFSPDKYETLKRINRKLQSREDGSSLATTDLNFTCKEPKFQNIVIEDAGPAVWTRNEKFKRAVLEKASEFYPKLNPFRGLTTDELREKLGLGGGSSGAAPGSDISSEDYSNILNNI